MIPILMYHQIDVPAPRGTPYRSLTVHPGTFRRQMTWMRRLGYQGLPMRELMPYLRGERRGKVFGLTFDDGYHNVLENALPVLAACGFRATCYFVARQLGGTNAWDEAEGVPAARLMDAQAMRAWVAAGHEAGSHTLNHPVLPRISPELAANEISESRRVLEALLDQPVRAFCYPYGKLTPAIVDRVRQAGYENATTTQRGLARQDDDLFILPRVTVSRSTVLPNFLLKCLTRAEERKRG